MATHIIGDYTAANSIDGSTNYLLIQPGDSSTAYNKINRNVFLGVTGQPADISTAQNLTNKTLNNTNSVTLKDTSFTLQDDSDTTKQAQFQLSGITTGTTRTYTLPNASSTLADISSVQTLTNKTLTSPTITGGSIDNTTVTVDTIAGHTVAGNGTVYGLSIHSGVIQTSGAGGTTLLQTNAVQGNQLATNAITLGYAQVTANQTGLTSTLADLTGLSVTVTVPAGNRRVKVTGFTLFSNGTSGGIGILAILEGTTQLNLSTAYIGNTLNGFGCIVEASFIPTAGSHTYKLQAGASTGSGTANSNTNAPSFILVELI